MSKKKTASDPFTSFRILGKKAQELMQRAAEMRRKNNTPVTEALMDAAPAQEDILVRFSISSVAQATFAILGIGLLVLLTVMLRETIIIVLLSFFVAAVIDPGVRWLERLRFPRSIAILCIYVLAILVITFLFVSLIPIIARQLQDIAQQINTYVSEFLRNPEIRLPYFTYETNAKLTEFVRSTLENLSITKFTDALLILGQDMSSIAQGSFQAITTFVGSVGTFVIQFILVLVLTFFIQIERENIRLWLRSFFSSQTRAYMDIKTEAIHEKIGQWARGQMILGLIVGSLVFIAMSVLGMPYAATLGVLAGFTEFIPYIGPFIAAAPAVLIGLTQEGPVWGLIVLGVYYAIQWTENNFLVPLIMKRPVGLSPIVIIPAMLTGLSFPDVIHPILGLLLAVPITTIITIFLDDWKVVKKS